MRHGVVTGESLYLGQFCHLASARPRHIPSRGSAADFLLTHAHRIKSHAPAQHAEASRRAFSAAQRGHLMLRHSSGSCGMAQKRSSRVLPCAIMQLCRATSSESFLKGNLYCSICTLPPRLCAARTQDHMHMGFAQRAPRMPAPRKRTAAN
jgi:hypothetical protein